MVEVVLLAVELVMMEASFDLRLESGVLLDVFAG